MGNDEIMKQIAEGTINFDKLITTPDMMQSLKPFARILGPKGLMPNPKSNTLVKPDDLLETIKVAKQGLIEYRVNEHSDIMVKIGLKEFENEALL